MTPATSLVLIVEDEPLVRELASCALSEAGFDTLEAANAQDALDILNSRKDVGVLCTDVDMPGPFDGYQLAKLVHQRWPSIRLVVTSGRALPGPVPDHGKFVSKPYSLQALEQTVMAVSDQDEDGNPRAQ
jgi:CheY-like chemotaxis protein